MKIKNYISSIEIIYKIQPVILLGDFVIIIFYLLSHNYCIAL